MNATHRDNIFDLDFTVAGDSTPVLDFTNDSKPASSLFDSLQEELKCDLNVGSDDDDLITLNLEPVPLNDQEELAPENEEERNVFESFESLLNS